MAQSELGCSKYKTTMLIRQIVLLPFGEERQFLLLTFYMIFYYCCYYLSLRYYFSFFSLVSFSFYALFHTLPFFNFIRLDIFRLSIYDDFIFLDDWYFPMFFFSTMLLYYYLCFLFCQIMCWIERYRRDLHIRAFVIHTEYLLLECQFFLY